MSKEKIFEYVNRKQHECIKNDTIPDSMFKEYGVNRGLRDISGNGVLTGLTNISKIESSKIVDGVKVGCDGELWYRGYNVKSLIKELGDNEYGFERTAYLLLFGEKPTKAELDEFEEMLII
ncbi:MAG: citrate/2-methylcitrate synthase, partial [Oscillospiraceae bacterium]